MHDYVPIYAHIFRQLGALQPLRTLEVGLGTRNKNMPSFMSMEGSIPGSSLRAFRDYLPNAEVHGADIDASVLFSEARIRTAWVDQLNFTSLHALHRTFGAN